jgi:hypothetical protein
MGGLGGFSDLNVEVFDDAKKLLVTESDAMEWPKDRLRRRPQRLEEIIPDFRIAAQSFRKGDALPELQDILHQNFIQEPDGQWRTPDPNEAKDSKALRTKVLLKECNDDVAALRTSRPRSPKRFAWRPCVPDSNDTGRIRIPRLS